ncbi:MULTISPECIES: KilA-N domain-containing protein [unclassified Thalassospira]|uniref:KilA-N domain-containing protein n=1 Tax=unclassified Thalassospira TaxID=2648997 RepID=UPI0011814775|nr:MULTISPECIES: KilA-N domain-containing protein [unclassified Thalassospira]
MNTQLIPHTIDNKTICQRKEDGYIHATAMCQAGGKRWDHYRANATTEDFLQALASDTGIPASQLVISKKGNSASFKQGTWVHPKVALHLAQWISPKFAVQVVNWVYDWMNDRTGRNPLAHRPIRLPRWTPTRGEMRDINSRASQILQTRFGAVRDALVAQIRADRLAGHDRPLSDYAIEPTTLLPANDPGLPKLADGQALFMIRGVPVLIDFTDAQPAQHRDVIAIPVADGNGPARFTIEDTPPAPNWFDRCYLAKPSKPRNLVRPVVVVIGTIIKEGCNAKSSLDDSNSGDRRGRDDDGV